MKIPKLIVFENFSLYYTCIPSVPQLSVFNLMLSAVMITYNNCIRHKSFPYVLFIKPGTCGWRAPSFLKLFLCRCLYVCMSVCVCPPPRLLITSGMIWTPYDW